MNTITKIHLHGPQKPRGNVTVSGAKNSATRLMCAAMLTDEPVTLTNFPTTLVDVGHKTRFMRNLGIDIELDETSSSARIASRSIDPAKIESYAYPIRTTYLLVAGQLARTGRAVIPYPGGCHLGERKHDQHIMVWEKFGCTVEEKADHIAISGRLKGARIDFPISTVGGTENALLCASVAAGDTEIHNAYVTPEVENLIDLLRLMGAEISMAGMSKIRVRGGQRLRGASIEVIPDRIEAITWMVWAAISGGDITVHRVPFSLMEIPLIHLRKAGIDFLASSDAVSISPVCLQGGAIQPFEVACGTHPGVISDMQPFYVLLGLHAEGRSKVYDYRYPERTAYVGELSKLYPGALQWTKGEVTTSGPVTAQGAQVTSTDLRGSMALLMAATVASGESSVDKVFMALRGYDRLLDKMNALGLTVAECPGT